MNVESNKHVVIAILPITTSRPSQTFLSGYLMPVSNTAWPAMPNTLRHLMHQTKLHTMHAPNLLKMHANIGTPPICSLIWYIVLLPWNPANQRRTTFAPFQV
jgi:hypothetical protein